MAIYNWTARKAAVMGIVGIQVEQTAQTLPQSTAAALFNITGGRVLMTGILGEVTTIFGAVATNLNLQSNPTTGTTSVLDAVVASANKEVGTLMSITGAVGDAMLADDAGGVQLGPRLPGVVLPVGTLEWNTNANNTGAAKWTLWYVPIDDGALVTAA